MWARVREDVEQFLAYAGSLQRKLVYTSMVESLSRPRVFQALRWNWLESDWHNRNFVHVFLPKQFRPQSQGDPRKFEPIMFLGPKDVSLLKQHRDARAGRPPPRRIRFCHCHSMRF